MPYRVVMFVLLFCFTGVFAQSKSLDGRYIVVLDAPSAANLLTAGAEHKVASTQQRRALVQQTQMSFVAQAKSTIPALQVHRQFSTLTNALDVSVSDNDLDSLKNLPGVKRVYPVKLRYANLDVSHQVIKSEVAWTQLGGQSEAGKGIKVAIIDSGIAPDHPMFSGEGFEAPDLSDNTWLAQNPDYCRADNGDPGFCNNKIIVARVFPPTDDLFPGFTSAELSPEDNNRHGSHVAGIAAGNPVDITFEGVDVSLSGVAPGAYLMVYKALFENGGVIVGSDSMLLAAMENAVNDGADVINNSWGSIQDDAPEDTVFAEVYKTAEEMGIVVVSSAGNNGQLSPAAINCPGCIESGITVANSTVARTFGHRLRVNGQTIVSSTGDNQQVFGDLNLTISTFSTLDDALSNGCTPLATSAFSGMAVVLNYTNECTIETIVENVANAQGQAVILFQDTASDFDTLRPFNQFSGDFILPVLGVTHADGIWLEEQAVSQSVAINISGEREALVDVTAYNQLNPGSSVGPNSDPNILKPDITAPGTDILSAAVAQPDIGIPPGFTTFDEPTNDEAAFALVSGTSMSSPHVAGAAALLRQVHPDWSAVQIKTALTSTAVPEVRVLDKPATPLQQGAGIMDIPAAINASVTFEASSHAHGACVASCNFTNQVTNVTDIPQTWNIEIQLSDPKATYTLQQDTLALSEAGTTGASQQLNFSINTASVDHGTWVFGSVILRQGSETIQRLPVAVFANDNSDTRFFSTNMSLDPEGSILATARVRNLDFVRNPSLRIAVPENASIDPDSIQSQVSNGETTTIGVSDAGNLRWQGTLENGAMALNAASPWNGDTLKSRGVQPVYCRNGCNTFAQQFDFTFNYHGATYTGVTVSSNGFLVAGKVDFGPFDAIPGFEFPSEDNINNVIAPLWGDYDLLDPNDPMDTGSGQLYIDIVEDNGANYLIVEWNQVAIFGFDEGDRGPYTFQVIIKENSDEIVFNYIDIPDMPSATIGAENGDATLGVTYFNGQVGSPLPVPVADPRFALALEVQPAGVIDINYTITLSPTGINTQDDSIAIDEDTTAIISVLDNDAEEQDFVVTAALAAKEQITESRRLIKLPPQQFDVDSLAIVSAPQSGQANVTNGQVEYVPNAHFYGTDFFEYQVLNDSGQMSNATRVSITVAPVNDIPVVEPISAQQVNAGSTVTIRAQGTDADNDSLSWTWTQTQGASVTLNTDGGEASFVAPQSNVTSTFVFSVVASDGQADSEPQMAQVTVSATPTAAPGSSGGSLTLYAIWGLLLLTIWRRGRV